MLTRLARLVGLSLIFAVLATANAGGYRYGVSDQAFYIPAVALRADPTLFPRDRAVFEPQMRFWVGDEILGTLVRTTGVSLPSLFAGLYVLTLGVFVAGVVSLARAWGCGPPTIAMALGVMTLRHRIAKTGANSLEGYMHPRMLAFAIGLLVLASVVRRRWGAAVVGLAVAALVHPSTAIWFAGVALVAWAWNQRRRVALLAAAGAVAATVLVVLPLTAPAWFQPMDDAWLAVLADRDYLFSMDWPAYAWILNLGYVGVLLWLWRHRRARHQGSAGEAGLAAGLVALVIVFGLTLVGTERHLATVVTLQANRIFWLLDAVVAILGSWWIAEELPRLWHRRAGFVLLLLIGLGSAARGFYVLRVETDRPLVAISLAATAWTDVGRWLGTQPTSWHVLADPDHAYRYGPSVRALAFRDTALELGKDPAMAMYDPALAARVADRSHALGAFDSLTRANVQALDQRYAFDVFVDHASRTFDFPVLYRNTDFVVYDLR